MQEDEETNWEDQEEIIEEEVGEEVQETFDEIEIEEEHNLTIQEIQEFLEWDTFYDKNVLSFLEEIYQEDWSEKILNLLIESYVNVYDYTSALEYLEKAYEKDPLLEEFSEEKVFYIFFNWIEFTSSNIEKLTEILSEFYMEDKITSDQYNFYQSLLEIVEWNKEQFFATIEEIEVESEYGDFLNDIQQVRDEADRFKDVPDYYETQLIAFILLQHDFYRVARAVSSDVLELDSDYILANQVAGYASFVMWEYQTANTYFRHLLDIDMENSSMYNFFVWVSFFWQEDYPRAITFLDRVENSEYLKDSQRYKLLAYHNLWDIENLLSQFVDVLDYRPLTEYDYYTFFDLFFFEPWEENEEFTLFEENISLVAEYIRSCYQDMENDDNFICRYWRAGFHVARGDKNIAKRFLEYIADRYPRDYIYKSLGDLYVEEEEMENAKESYMKAIYYSQDNDFIEEIRTKLIDVVFDN